jgi:uncharacterized protein YdeI (YjbR/CyaY-like superfamily)
LVPKKDPRIDEFIETAPEFARPILSRIRKLIHAACPDVTETIKWSSPFYEYKGILVATPSFKRHCALIFWKGRLLFKDLPASENPRKRLRHITSASELPVDRVLTGYIKQAVALNETGVKNPARNKSKAKKPLPVPDYFLTALRKSKKALAAFEKLSPSCKREYIEWIVEAKREETRAKRMKTAIEWITQGKSRNWKYK